MAFPGSIYAPPNVYTRTNFENPTQGLLEGLKIPVFIGTGSEVLSQNSLEIVRGSSATVDQQIVEEDLSGRAVVSIAESGAITLGAFDGVLTRVQVRHYPIVKGDGTGTTATNTSSVSVTVDGDPVVILSINGTSGVLELSVAPDLTSTVRATYFFKRTDTETTDDVSDQVTEGSAILYGQVGESYEISADVNDEFLLTVDSTSITVTLSEGTWTAAQIVVFINSAAGATSLVASTYEDNYGSTAVQLTADQNIEIGAGSANSTLGFTSGDVTGRNKVFYVFNGPVTDGSNGGITTTDPADVTVKVDGVQVIPTSVDGASRAVTLSYAPADGSTVTIRYDFNTWQDTFDYLAHTGITAITRCGVAPGRLDYVDGTDFILQDDKIVWGTAVTVTAGEHTSGKTYFNTSQITPTLVDTRGYMSPCTAVTDSSVSPPVTSTTTFKLPLVPTTGNGRGSPLGSSLFQTVANDRIDLPTNRPDLVIAYWGFGVQDAIERGAVAVLKVASDTAQITLKDPVPVGATVYATIYYNTLTDQQYTLTVGTAGAAGVGTYTITNEDGEDLYTPTFGTKGAGLAGITIQFPSGSERLPDCRFEPPFDTTDHTGAVEEDVTITFRNKDGTLAKYTIPNSGPYVTVADASDHARLLIDGSALAGAATGIDLTQPAGQANLGFFASLLGAEAEYEATTGGVTYEIDATNDEINLTVDGVLIQATAGANATATLADYVTAINSAAAATAAELVAAGRFDGATTITLNEYDEISFVYQGDVSGASATLTGTLTPATYASATTLAAEVQTAVQAAIVAGIAIAGDRPTVTVSADADGRMVFSLLCAVNDATGFLAFITHATPAQDFAVLAGIDTAASVTGAQTKVVDGPIARRFTIAGDQTSALLYDRIILRNRVIPGFSTVHPELQLSYAGIAVEGSTGGEMAGLDTTDSASAGWRAAVIPATILGYVGFTNGQVATGTYGDVRDGQPVVTFYADGGTTDQNNVFKFTMDGVPVTVQFTDAAGAAIASGGSADVPLGPAGTVNTVLGQIRAAITAAGLASASSRCFQEGGAIRLVSLLSTTASQIVIGTGNANTTLGFSDGDVMERTLPSVGDFASALMGHTAASVANSIIAWDSPTATYFAAEALASVEKDASNAEYLFIQSQGGAGLGTTSSVAWAAATADDVLSQGVGLGAEAGDGASGEVGISGFYVISSDTVNGSGTVNNSILNSSNDGTGQDGVVGQTYRDLITGLTFTILPREGNINYPGAAATDSFTFRVRKTVTTDSNSPIYTIPGVSLLVTNTQGIGTSDTAIVETFERGGEEPAIGDVYYVSYNYNKQDFTTQLYTKFSTIEAAYGSLSPENPVVLAAYLAMMNGAVLVGIKQVQKDTDTNSDGEYDKASTTAFRDAVDTLARPLPGGLTPDILVPLKGDALDLFQYISRHCDIQSSIRYRAERTCIAGVSAGTLPKGVQSHARGVGATRFRIVYPDIAYLTLTQADGTDEEFLVDGTYIASALTGSVVSPSVDVATPWTGRKLNGFNKLARTLDAVEQNQIAVAGVTVIEDRPPVLRVRQGLTTDMSDVLHKLPTIIMIADEVQRQTRATLDRFIGNKFLPGILSQIEGQLSNTLKLLVDAQIISAYTGVKAQVSPDDPTTAEVEAYYAPVFPLLYICVTFNLRSSL